jgi:hypothetical protein
MLHLVEFCEEFTSNCYVCNSFLCPKFFRADMHKLIGTVDMKSIPTYFYAQMTSSFSTVNTAVSFGSVKLNVGNAFTASTGIFVAPTPGRYYTILLIRVYYKW